jgi:hypothetical protein
MSLSRPGKVYSGLGLVNLAQAAAYLLFNIPVTYNLIYNAHINYIEKGYFGIPGVISPTLAPEVVEDSQSRAQTSIMNIPKSQTHILIKTDMLACIGLSHAIISNVLFDIYLICWLLWVISKYYCAFFSYIDILPLGLCLIDIVCLDNAGILPCLLWPYRYFSS